MGFKGFEQQDFDAFKIESLAGRMQAIQKHIQPKFKAIGSELVDYLSMKLGNEMYVHIARHARRTVNPPDDTWMAFSLSNRGYKMLPHFQVGLWDDRLFIWLAYIYEIPNKKDIASLFIDQIEDLKEMIPGDYDLSKNHMKKSNDLIQDLILREQLDRFRDVKSSELLIGKQYASGDPILKDGDAFLAEVKSVYDTLIPIYQLSLENQ